MIAIYEEVDIIPQKKSRKQFPWASKDNLSQLVTELNKNPSFFPQIT